MKKIKIVQIRSGISRTKRQNATLRCLGLGKIGKNNILNATPQIMGMVNKVSFLVNVDYIVEV